MVGKVLVTGGAGFIGSHIVDALITHGHQVRVLDMLEPQVHGEACKIPVYLHPEVELICGDMLNDDDLKRAIAGVEIIFHDAAAVGIGQSMYKIAKYVQINTLGTAKLMDFLVNQKNKVEKVIIAASMSSYGEGTYECKSCGVVYPKLRSEAQMQKGDWEVHCPHCSAYVSPISTNPPSGKRKVTLYFPCYNAEKYIGDCLEGALKQTYPIEEILVIDDGSTDGSMEIVSQYPVKIIQHEVNKGLAAARNTAIQNATGDFIASLDSDCVPEPDWLERLMENFTLENIAGVGGKLLEAHTINVADLWRSVHLKQHWGDEKIANPDFLFGADNVYRKDALMKAGLYNEEYRTNYEDCDMFARLRKMGYTMVYEPKAIARHLRSDDVCSVVKTLWNWNKPLFQKDGCFDNFERLTQKINLNTVLAARYLMEDITNRKCQILYPDLLISAYHSLLDLKFYHNIQSTTTSENQLGIIEQTFNALIILATWIAQQKSKETELYKFIGEDLLTIQLNNPQTPPLSLEELLEELNAQTPDALDIDKYPSLHEAYLNHFFNSFQQLFDKIDDPLVVKMIEVSARNSEFGIRNSEVKSFHHSSLITHHSPVKVLLANPPWRKGLTKGGNRYGVRAGSRWPFTMNIGNAPIPGYIPFPFFLAYATSLLKKHGIDAVIVDAIAEGLTDEEFIHRVRGYKPDLILIETATASIDVDLNVAERLKSECDNDVYIALSGTHATVMKESLLKEHEYIDFILYGEYEFTLLELVQSLQNGANLEEVQGLAFRLRNSELRNYSPLTFFVSPTQDTTVIVTPPRPLIENLDELPWPERLSLPMYNYNDQFAGMPYPNVQVMASRGCPFQCIFCVWPQILYGGAKYRTRSEKDVVDEIEWLIDYYGFEAFYFDDDTFNIGKKRILAICDEIKQRGIDVPWAVMARADTSDYETLKAMADAGLYAIKFGVESGVQELVDNCGKKLDLSKVEEAVRHCKELGIKTHLTFTFGLPGETRETIQKTIDFAIELDPDSVQFSLTTPFPGTKYFDMLDEKGLLCSKNWADYDGALSAVIQTENLTREELEAALAEANRRWNEHLRRRGQVRIGQPREINDLSLRSKAGPVLNVGDVDRARTSGLLRERHDRLRIVFVCWVNHVRAFKQAYALSKHFADKYELILLVTPFVNVFSDMMESVFDRIIFYNNVDELRRILLSLKPDLIHYHSQWSATWLGVAAIESAHCPVIMDVYDSVSLMRCHLDDVAPVEKDLMSYEKFCFENCDGIIYKGSEEEMRFYESTFGIKVESLKFMDYCVEDFCIDKKLSNPYFNGKDIHIVYAGGVNPITDDKDAFSNAQFLDVATFLASQRMHFHIYPNAFPSHKERYAEYLSFDESCEYFHFHDPLPYEKLIKQISQYDYGWHVHTYTSSSKISRLKQQWTTGNKLFTYLEASIPPIVSKNLRYTFNLVAENQLGIGMEKEYSSNLIEEADIVELKSQLTDIDGEALRKNIENIRQNSFGLGKNVERLVKFYERMLTE